jgi:hypothetical protein
MLLLRISSSFRYILDLQRRRKSPSLMLALKLFIGGSRPPQQQQQQQDLFAVVASLSLSRYPPRALIVLYLFSLSLPPPMPYTMTRKKRNVVANSASEKKEMVRQRDPPYSVRSCRLSLLLLLEGGELTLSLSSRTGAAVGTDKNDVCGVESAAAAAYSLSLSLSLSMCVRVVFV